MPSECERIGEKDWRKHTLYCPAKNNQYYSIIAKLDSASAHESIASMKKAGLLTCNIAIRSSHSDKSEQ